MKILTKSLFLNGREGDKFLWICANRPETLPRLSLFEEDNIQSGIKIGELAKKLFEGTDLKDLTEEESLKKTSELMNKKTLFEATFLEDNFYCKIDVLRPSSNGFDVFEVKSSSSVKPKHLDDLAFQKMVLEKSGLKVNSYNLILINGDYKLKDAFCVEEFFKVEDVTQKILSLDVKDESERMLKVINQLKCPEFDVEDLSKTDNGNFLVDEFKNDQPIGSIFDLYSIRRKKAVEFFKAGFVQIKDLPGMVELTPKQVIQLEAGEGFYVNKEMLSKFLSKIDKPICHLDFEAYQQVIPKIKNTSAYQQIPFQYSLHIEDENGLIHKEFLYEKGDDPRPMFLKKLKEDLPSKGSILVYYKPFEVGRLKELAQDFPEYKDFVSNIISRVIDLRDPFSNFWFYSARQKGSCSIKEVLPLFSEMNHKELNLSSGSSAMILYKTHKGNLTENIRKDLLEYCKLDTLAMVIILEGLRKSFYN